MNVLLVNPPSTGVFSTFGINLPPMGLLYVAASLEQAGHTVVVRDLSLQGEKLSAADLKGADIVGISSDSTRIEKAMAVARKAARAGLPVVMGGPHPQFLADEICACGAVSYIVKGEGEPVFPALLAALEKGEDTASVLGLIYRQHGRIIETPDAVRPDVESLPWPARHLVDLQRYSGCVDEMPLTPIVTSRGCPGACHFCSSSSFFGRGWRYRSAESVLLELDDIYNHHGFRAVAFLDDNFTLLPERVEKIADGIIERGYDLRLWNFSRVDTIVNNPGMVRKLARAGSRTIYLGIESDSADTLNSLGKNTTVADVERAVLMLKENNIEVFGSYIIGSLGEDRADIERTIELAIRLDTSTAQFSILTPYPGTQLYQEIKDRIFKHRWKFYDGLHLVFRHPKINRHILQMLLLSAFMRFYRRSRKSIEGFNHVAKRNRPSFKKMMVCAWDLFF
ncbi:MAG: B12-binding domain-containing radical SAM protein [Geobacteraceae bacterium]|nr:B12-binding domain-containing radical SAM protein [Geobacteraceae bacterium]